MRKHKGVNDVVHPRLHQSELGIIIHALDIAIDRESCSTYITAFERVRRKLSLNRNSNHFCTEDHRRYNPWIKHEHGSEADDEVAEKAKAETDRIAKEKELAEAKLSDEAWLLMKRQEAYIERHNEAVSYS